MMIDSPFERAQKKFDEEYNKREKDNFTSLKSELWWFVRNCSEDNFHEPLQETDKLTDELLQIIEKWKEEDKKT